MCVGAINARVVARLVAGAIVAKLMAVAFGIQSSGNSEMLKHRLILPEGILLIEPDEPLQASDFASVAAEIDPYIAQRGKLPGVLIHAKSFPGWVNFAAAMAHMNFVESHHANISKLAVVSDNLLLANVPEMIRHLIDIDIKHFPESALNDASTWLEER